MSVLPSRPPFVREAVATFTDVARSFERVERAMRGLFTPTTLVAARSPYSVKGTEWLILCDCTAGAITLTFPDAALVDGMFVTVRKTDTSANAERCGPPFQFPRPPFRRLASAELRKSVKE